MILSVGNENYTVPGKNLRVSGSFALVRKELGGFTSGTDFSSGGVKPKRLSVALELPFSRETDLQQLTAIATAVDGIGDPIVYDIVDRTARGLMIRQVKFQDSFRVEEHDTLQVWSVSFVLDEFRSIPEMTEERQDAVQVSVTTADGVTIAPQDGGIISRILQGMAKQ